MRSAALVDQLAPAPIAPREFLFATWEGGGDLPPFLTLAKRLLARGHRVRVMGEACAAPEVEHAGAEFVSYCEAPSRREKGPLCDPIRDWEVSDPEEGLGRLIDRMMCGPALAHARDVLAELARHPADAIVAADLLYGPMVAAEAARVPWAVLACHIPYHPLPGVPPFGPGLLPARTAEDRSRHAAVAAWFAKILDRGVPPVNAARAALGLPPIASLVDQLANADRHFVAAASAFDFPAERLPANMRYIGPLLDEPSWAKPWISPWPEAAEPLIVVAFSTTFQNQSGALQRAIDAIGALPARGLVTLGPSVDAALLTSRANVVVRHSAPHDAVMRRASVVVTHCGHGTVARALAHRVPLLCMPMGRDQNDNAARVVARGAGLQLDAGASVAEIREALRRLLCEPGFRSAADRLGGAIAAEMAASPVIEDLEALAARAAAVRETRSAVA